MKVSKLAVVCLASVGLFAGCEKKEEVLDVDTPAGGIEIQKGENSVEIDLNSKDGDEQELRIEVPKKDEDSPDESQ